MSSSSRVEMSDYLTMESHIPDQMIVFMCKDQKAPQCHVVRTCLIMLFDVTEMALEERLYNRRYLCYCVYGNGDDLKAEMTR
jgi:hypothetical protein